MGLTMVAHRQAPSHSRRTGDAETMTANSLPQSAVIVADVESFFDSLPAKRRRKRIASEPDQTTESENYTDQQVPEAEHAALDEFRKLLRQLGQARSDVVAEILIAKIFRLLDLPLDGGR